MTELKSAGALSSDALARLVAAHRDFLTFVERRVESREAAEDILQAAFARSLERGSDVDEENVVAWFYRVLRNAIVDHYRRRSTAAKGTESWEREFVDRQEPDAELKNDICQCVSGLLETLKPEYRNALQLVDLQDCKLADFAQKAGISEGNAAVRVHRARAALRARVRRACGTCAEHGCVDCCCRAAASNPSAAG